MIKNRYSKLYVTACSFFICTAILLGSFQNAKASSREGIAAIVNDEIVSFSDVRSRMRLNTVASNVADTATAQQRLQIEVLNNLIDEAVQLQEAKDLGIVVTEEQVEDEFSKIAQSNGYDLDTFKRAMAQKNVPLYTLREQIRSRIAWAQVVRRKLRSQINISESEIDAALDEEERNAGKPEFLAAEIFLKINNENDVERVKKTANEIMKKLISGSLFSEVARQYSDGMGAVNGGNLGWIKSGQLMPELDNALNQMKSGQVSPPIRSAKGVHILFLRDARIMGGSAPRMVENTQVGTVTEDVPKTTMVHLKQIFIPIKKTDPNTIVNAKLARARSLESEITTCSEMDRRSTEFVSSATGDLGRVALESLSDKIVNIVNALPIEKLSAPLRNDRGVFVLMVCERDKISNDNVQTVDNTVEGDTSSLRTDSAYRNKVANRLGMKRLDGLQRRYLKDLRATAFVDRRL